jgi:hypothetical protein
LTVQVLDPRAHDGEIKAAALWHAGRVKTYLTSLGRDNVFQDVWPTTPEGIRQDLNRIGTTSQTTLAGSIARMVDAGWWRKNLRRETLKANETVEHGAGLVRRKHQVYVSDHASKIKRERAKANRRTLEGLECVSDAGDVVNLQDAADASVSNPKLRRAELMTRCRGFEETAEFMGHRGLFLTITTPSRFHRVNHAGLTNKKWTGATPRDGQDYLCSVWARIRAAWAAKGIRAYGFRVAEPHHDGTPHWHILIFCQDDQTRDLLAIAARYALKDNPTETGAKKHRFTVKRIDPSQGSATGYIAKYIAKNIDGEKETGEGIGLDFDSGTPAQEAAKRVKDWATTWSIRQFQQVGGPSVTVWRELRRLGKDEANKCQLELFEKPRAAASRGDWFAFWMVQGGPEVARKDLSLKPFYVADDLGKYGDLMNKIKGVEGQDATGNYLEVTRLKTWTVQRAGLETVNTLQADFDERMTWAKQNAGFVAAYADAEFKRLNEVERTRTGINNCRDTPPATFDFSSFDPDEAPPIYATGEPRMGSPRHQAEVIAQSLDEMHNYPDLSVRLYQIALHH